MSSFIKRLRTGAPSLLLAAVVLAASVFGLYRLQFGVDFRDEGFYLALPWIFSHGAIPFTHEFAVQQTSGLLLIPLVKIYSVLAGASGIVLTFRILFFAFAIAIGLFCSRLGKQTLPVVERIAFASLAWLFWPFSIPNFSYNTISSLLFAAGLFAASTSLAESGKKSQVLMALAGASMFICVLSYPPMIAAAFVAVICLKIVFFRNQDRYYKQKIFFGLLGFSAPALIFAVLFSVIGWGSILAAFRLHTKLGSQAGSAWKIVGIAREFLAQSGFTWSLLIGVAVVYVLLAQNRKRRALIPFVVVGLICWLQRLRGPLFLPSYLLAAGALFLPLVPDAQKREVGKPFKLIWIPSLVAGLVTAFTSSNGFVNAMIGCMGGALFSLYLALTVIEGSDLGWKAKRWIAAGTAIAPILTCFLLARNSVYGDHSPYFSLESRVESGPYAGLITTRSKAKFIADLVSDLFVVRSGKSRVLFYDNFPGGYLFTDLPNTGPSIWFYDVNYKDTAVRRSYADFFSEAKNQPDLVVELKDSRWNFSDGGLNLDRDVLTNVFPRLGYKLASEREFYWLWIRP